MWMPTSKIIANEEFYFIFKSSFLPLYHAILRAFGGCSPLLDNGRGPITQLTMMSKWYFNFSGFYVGVAYGESFFSFRELHRFGSYSNEKYPQSDA